MNKVTPNDPIVVRVTCVNAGTSDAILNEFGADFFFVKRNHLLPVNHTWRVKTDLRGTRLPSGINMPLPDFTHALVGADVQAIGSGLSQLYCAGYVHYSDGIGNVRTTAFCRLLHRVGIEPYRFVTISDPDPDYEYQD